MHHKVISPSPLHFGGCRGGRWARHRGPSCGCPPSSISQQLFHREDLWQPISHCSISLSSLTVVNKGNVDILIDKFMLDAMWLLTGKFNSFLNIPGSKEIVLALMSDHRPGRMKTDWTRQQREREKCGRKTAARPLMKIVKSEMMLIVVLCNSDGWKWNEKGRKTVPFPLHSSSSQLCAVAIQ